MHNRQKECWDVLEYVKTMIKQEPNFSVYQIITQAQKFYFENSKREDREKHEDIGDRELGQALKEWWRDTKYETLVSELRKRNESNKV